MISQNAPAVKGSNPIRPNSCDALTKYLTSGQQCPQGSRERDQCFQHLVYHLKPHLRCKYSHLISKEDHEEAENDTILAVYNQIDRLTPSYIVPFAKKVLKNKVVDQIRKQKKRTVSLDESMSDGETSFLETIAQPEPDPLILAVNDLVEKDPHKMLQKTMRGGQPNITYQSILKLRLQGYQWKELAQFLGKTIPTLNSFDKREMKRLNSYLRESLLS